MKRKRTPTVEEVDDKLHEIAYGQPPKQPWPRRAKITVWVLSILLAGFAVLYCASSTVPAGDYITDGGDIHLLNRRVPELPAPKQAPTKTVREL